MRGFIIKLVCHTCGDVFGLCDTQEACSEAEDAAVLHLEVNPEHEIDERHVLRPDNG